MFGRFIDAAMVLSLSSAAALAADPPNPVPAVTTVAEINGWQITDNKGDCSAITTYQRGIYGHVGYDFGRDSAFLTIFDPAWESVQNEAPYKVTLRFTNGSEFTDAPAFGIRNDTASGRLTGINVHLDGTDFMRDFASATGVEMFIGDTRLGALSLKGTREVARRLNECAIDSYKRYPPDPFATITSAQAPSAALQNRVEPSRAKAILTSYISDDDYPASALRANEQGTVGFRLAVGPDGRITECTITTSSGSTALDAATCRVLTSRARFTPARDSTGAETTDIVVARYVWRIHE